MKNPEFPRLSDQGDDFQDVFHWLEIDNPKKKAAIIHNIQRVPEYYDELNERGFLFAGEELFQQFFEELGRGLNHINPSYEEDSIVPYIIHREERKAGGGSLSEKKKNEIKKNYGRIISDFFNGNNTYTRKKSTIADLTYVLQAFARSKGKEFIDVYRSSQIQGMDLWVTISSLYRLIHNEIPGRIPESKIDKLKDHYNDGIISLTIDWDDSIQPDKDREIRNDVSYNPSLEPVDAEGYVIIPISSWNALPEKQASMFVGDKSIGYLNTDIDFDKLIALFKTVSPNTLTWANILRVLEIRAEQSDFTEDRMRDLLKRHDIIAENFIKIFHMCTSESSRYNQIPQGVEQAIHVIRNTADYTVSIHRLLILQGRMRQMLPDLDVHDRLLFAYKLITALGFRVTEEKYSQ